MSTSSQWLRRVVAFVVLLLVIGPAAVHAQQMYDPAQEGGSLPQHGALHLLPWETIDTYSGAVTLSFVDLALPGNAGFGVSVRRVYNSKNNVWVIDAGAPSVIFSQGYPLIFNSDGSTTHFIKSFTDPHIYYSTTFSKFDTTSQTMVTAGGITYHFRPDGFCDTVTDSFGNTVSSSYSQQSGGIRLYQLVQSLGSQSSRVVTFGYDLAGNVSSMTYGGRVWEYIWQGNLTQVNLPTGQSWHIGYTDLEYRDSEDQVTSSGFSMQVTTPTGGWVSYACLSNVGDPPNESDTRWSTNTVRERQTGGPDIAPGRWTFTYSNAGVHQDTVVDGADGTSFHAAYRHQSSYWEAPLEYVIEGAGTNTTVTTTYTWQGGVVLGYPEVYNGWAQSMSYAILPDTQTVTVNGKNYTKTYTFETDSFNHFGQAKVIDETGDFTRTTTVDSFHTFTGGLYRADAPTSVTVTSAGDSQTVSTTYDNSTGFLLTRTAGGVTTRLTPGDFGNVYLQSVGPVATPQDTWFEYDKGVVSAIHGPISTVTREINDDGSVATQTQAGRTTTFDYYPDGRPHVLTPPLGNASTTTYASDGSWIKVARGEAWTKACLDGFGRAKATITSALVRTDVAYDAMGRVRRTSLPFGTSGESCPSGQADTEGAATTFVYDILGRLTSQTNPDGTFTALDYTTESGQSPHILTTMGHWDGTTPVVLRSLTQIFKATGSPANACLRYLIDAVGTTTYDYNGLGSLKSITSPTQATVPTSVTRSWTYDANNRLASAVLPESGETQFTYDDFGRLSTRRTVSLDQTTTYHYDAESRIIAVDSPVSAYSVTGVEYDDWGNRTAVSNGLASSTFGYDAANRLRTRTDVINGHRFETGFDFDLNDNLKDVWYPSGNHVHYAYDTNNRLTGVSDSTRGLTFADDFHYYDWGGLQDYTTGNGVVHSFEYDVRQRTHHIGSTKTTTDDVLGLTYGYDDVGNVTSIADQRDGQNPPPAVPYGGSFEYDTLNRLHLAQGPWGSLTWEYDAIGNRKSQTKVDPNNNTITTLYSYTSTNRLDYKTTGNDTETFHYDDAGRLWKIDQGAQTNAFIYDYTPNNLQETVNNAAGALTTAWYDADDQRVRKILGDGDSTYYLRGPMGVLSEFVGSGDLIGWSVDYIYAAGRLVATTKPPAGAWRSVTVTRYGGPGTVTSSPTGLDCGSACEGKFTVGSHVTLTATPNEGLTFLGWGGACGTGTSSTATVTVTAGTEALGCTATFSGGDPTQLTVSKTGSGSGTVSSSPGGISCGSTCSAAFAQGTWVTLTATPTTGSRFANWGGSCGTGTSSPVSVQVNAASSCTATFTQTYALTVTKSGDGAIESLVTSDPAGISCGGTCAATYDTGTSVTLVADAAEGYTFEGWSGTGCGTGTVTMDQARSCTAQFAAVPPPGCGPGDESACVHDGGSWEPESCTCNYWWEDPLVIPLDGHPVRLRGVAGGVALDVNGDGIPDRLAWTVAGAREGFLVLDRNGNGVVDDLSELFGQAVTGRRHPEGPANSFTLLAAYDRPENGGNGDGLISAGDAVFSQLRLWVDANHDGMSQPGELVTLAQAGIASIELSAQPIGRRDRFGNYFRARAVVHFTDGHQTTIWDVFLAARLNGSAPAAEAGVAWSGASRFKPGSAVLAGLGGGFIALGLAAVIRRKRRGHLLMAHRLLPSALSRTDVTGVAAVALVLLWPAATFGQTWQVVEYYDSDALGSVRAVTNQQGQVVARHDFLPFGEELTPQTPPHDKRLFTGQERDFETGQDYFNARQLRTDLGRFLSPDPMTSVPRLVGSQGVNGYAYVRNNPLNLVDPSGLDPGTLANEPYQDKEWTPTTLSGGNAPDSLDESFKYWDDLRALDAAFKQWSCAFSGGTWPQSGKQQPTAQTASVTTDYQLSVLLCPGGTTPYLEKMVVTGYDNSYGSTGKNPGDPNYGITAHRTTAGLGTIAADPKYHWGMVMYIPGYGTGSVLDRGGAITGNALDVWFPSPEEANAWGRQTLYVTICPLPPGK